MTCAVCESPYLGQVQTLLSCGADASAIATATTFDQSVIEQHIRDCCTVVSTDGQDTLEASDRRLRGLVQRISIAGQAAGLQGDLKSLLTALSAELRLESEIRSHLQARAVEEEKKKENGPDTPLTVKSLDKLIRKAEQDAASDPTQICNKVAGWLSLLPESLRFEARQSLREYLGQERAA